MCRWSGDDSFGDHSSQSKEAKSSVDQQSDPYSLGELHAEYQDLVKEQKPDLVPDLVSVFEATEEKATREALLPIKIKVSKMRSKTPNGNKQVPESVCLTCPGLRKELHLLRIKNIALRDDCTKLRSSLNSAKKAKATLVPKLEDLKVEIQTLLQENTAWQASSEKKHG